MNQIDDKNDWESKIMGQIKSGGVKIRSKYIFLAEKISLGSVLVFSILLAIFFFNLFLFYIKSTDNLTYLSFGQSGLLAFLETFPYHWLIIFVAALLSAGGLIARYDVAYKKPFIYIAVSLVALVSLAGSILAYTKMNDSFESSLYRNGRGSFFFKPFYRDHWQKRKYSVVGLITQINQDSLVLQDGFGYKKINFSEPKILQQSGLKSNQFVIAIGEDKGDYFLARDIRVVDKNDMPLMHRQIKRPPCFDQPSGMGRDEQIKCNCIKTCLDSGVTSSRKQCLDSCFIN